MTVVKSNLDNLYQQYLGSSFDISKFDRGNLSTSTILGHLIYHRLNACALLCIQQIKRAADGKKIVDAYKVVGIQFPVMIDREMASQIPELKEIIDKPRESKKFEMAIFDGNELTAKLTPYNLTSLHLAAIQGCHTLVSEMLKSGYANVDAKDNRDWTPMHHAALKGDRIMFGLLSSQGSNAKALNHREGTPEDLLRLCSPLPVDASQPLPCVVWHENKVQRPLTYGEFKRMTNADFITDFSVDPILILKDWHVRLIYHYSHPFYENFRLHERYREFKKQPPQLILEKDPALGLDVRTAVRLSRGQGAIEYLGCIVPPDVKVENANFQLDDVDGNHKRNLGVLINDGFPNVVSMTVRIGGIKRHLMFMLDDAEAGERLCWNYTFYHPVKTSDPHVEPRKDAMIDFFKKFKLKNLAKEISDGFNSGEQDVAKALDICSKANKLRYLIDTPSSLMMLIFTNVISLDDFEQVLNDRVMQTQLNIKPDILNSYKKSILPVLKEFLPLLLLTEQFNSAQENFEFRQVLLGRLETLSFDRNLTIYNELSKRWKSQ